MSIPEVHFGRSCADLKLDIWASADSNGGGGGATKRRRKSASPWFAKEAKQAWYRKNGKEARGRMSMLKEGEDGCQVIASETQFFEGTNAGLQLPDDAGHWRRGGMATTEQCMVWPVGIRTVTVQYGLRLRVVRIPVPSRMPWDAPPYGYGTGDAKDPSTSDRNTKFILGLPAYADFVRLESVQSIIERPGDESVGQSDFAQIVHQMPGWFHTWRDDIHTRLLKVADPEQSESNLTPEETIRRLQLVTPSENGVCLYLYFTVVLGAICGYL
ncbi:hypothetical protein BDZ89DRAFT_1233968 [Hymenopellis radicata]|nr:hypothetical protein BDZ89DRAFT_1233968 [Hymenopellis radicata]